MKTDFCPLLGVIFIFLFGKAHWYHTLGERTIWPNLRIKLSFLLFTRRFDVVVKDEFRTLKLSLLSVLLKVRSRQWGRRLPKNPLPNKYLSHRRLRHDSSRAEHLSRASWPYRIYHRAPCSRGEIYLGSHERGEAGNSPDHVPDSPRRASIDATPFRSLRRRDSREICGFWSVSFHFQRSTLERGALWATCAR